MATTWSVLSHCERFLIGGRQKRYVGCICVALKKNPLFEKIDWASIHNEPAPFVPNPDNDTDTSYFIGALLPIKRKTVTGCGGLVVITSERCPAYSNPRCGKHMFRVWKAILWWI